MSKRLTPDDVERIVELKLDRVPVRAIAVEVGCSTVTVQKRWNDYLLQRAAAKGDEAGVDHARVLSNLRQVADKAYRGYAEAMARTEVDDDLEGDALAARMASAVGYMNAARGFLAEARQAEREYARLSGMDLPSRLELSGPDKGPVQVAAVDAVAALRGRLDAMNVQRAAEVGDDDE